MAGISADAGTAAAYPPQKQPGYPPPSYTPTSATSLSSQHRTYPPQQAAFPQQLAACPPAPAAAVDYPKPDPTVQPPAYQAQPAAYSPLLQSTSTTTTNVVVVQLQPSTTAVDTTVFRRRYGSNDHGLVYAIIATCAVFWLGAWCGLICTIPGICFALSAQEKEHSGDLEHTRLHQKLSLVLTTVGLVVGFAILIIWIISTICWTC